MSDVDRVTVITLDRAPDRFANFLAVNTELPVERFPGTDGQTLDRWDCVDDGLITPGNPYSLSSLGAAASHVELWRRCAAENRSLHIAEDDAIFRRDFVETASKLLSSLADWDIVQWGWNFDWPLEVILGSGLGAAVITCSESMLRSEWSAFPPTVTPPVLVRLLSNTGTCAYSLSPNGAQRLLDRLLPIAGKPATFPGKPDITVDNRTLDVEMTRHYASMLAYVSVPCLAVSLNFKSAPAA